MITIYRLIVFLLLFQPGAASAVCIATGSNGDLSVESCAESQILFSIPALARVALLDDFSLGEFDYETAPQTTDDFCIWYNTEQFSMIVNSANSFGNNTFSLLGTNTDERIPYQLTWYDRTARSGSELNLSRLENVSQNQLALPEKPSDSGCAVNNVSINITVPLDSLEGKPEDSYSDVLTVTVSVD